ncbi:MAG: hypothetical protein WCT37_00395 [Patescibacteria group bacterium]|jgi:hypothetical protein
MANAFENRPFLSDESKKHFGEKWSTAAKDHYVEKPRDRRVMECRLADRKMGDYSREGDYTINELHGVDFLNEVIPGMIETRKAAGIKGKMKILDLGCGFGFFNDQIRSKFGDQVEVFGTSLVKKRAERRKKAIVQDIKQGKINLSAAESREILSQISSDLHPNDAKWRSILEMSDKPEFDLEIDSAGELLYSGSGFLPQDRYFDQTLGAAIEKLNPGGKLFVARTQGQYFDFLKEKFEAQYPVVIEKNETAAFKDVAFIVTKKADKSADEKI